jgi:hypothetical protein
MNFLRKVMWIFLLLITLIVAGVLSYTLPKHVVVNINGTEVKRMNNAGGATNTQRMNEVGTRDVYFINASSPDKTEVYTFRNEDTKFKFPWYLKFDSAEVQSRAQLISADSNNSLQQRSYALITYYGWRVAMLNWFPNAVDVEAWESTEKPFPLFNTIFLTLLGLAVVVLWWKLRRWKKNRQIKAAEKAALKAEVQAKKEAENV